MKAEPSPTWCDVRAVARAAAACAKRKRNRPDAIAFRARYGEEILALAARLQGGCYRPEPSRVFVNEHPKPREIHAAAFRDRVVHHLLYELLEPRFERIFIADSFSCRKGKGTHAAARRLQQHFWDATRHNPNRAWALQMDVRGFFCSIHKPTLLRLLSKGFSLAERQEAGPSLWNLTRTIVNHDPAVGVIRCGAARSFERVIPSRRLGALGPNRGLPIGDLTSQFFANVYIDALDQYVKRTLGVRNYVRYVDDFVLVHRSRWRLHEWEARIRAFLAEYLALEAHPVPELLAVSEGIDFVGYVGRPSYILPRRRVVAAMKEKLRSAEADLSPKEVLAGQRVLLRGIGQVTGPCTIQRLDVAYLKALRAVWGSYQGHLVNASAWRLTEQLWNEHPTSQSVLRMIDGRVTRRLLLPKPVRSLREQCYRLGVGLVPMALFVKVGRFTECRQRSAARKLGLVWNRRRGRWCASVPWMDMNRLLRRALGLRMAVAVAMEFPAAEGNVKARRLAALIRPAAAPLSCQRRP